MVKIFKIGMSGFKQNAYGNIQSIGQTQNGRAVYRVTDSQGEEAGKLSVPNTEVSQFEQAYKDIMEAAPQIQKYTLEHSSEEEIKKRKTKSRILIGTAGILGTAIPIAITQKASTTKKILSTVAGIITGLSAGFLGSLAITTPPGTYKFAKATRTFSKLDIQPVQDTFTKQ